MKKFILLFLYLTNINPVIILIHGTFASGENWYRPGGSFYNILEYEANKVGQRLIPFTWTGGLSDKDRVQGAEALARVILSYPKEENIQIIGHSHGGNVAMLASQMLADSLIPDNLLKKKKRWYTAIKNMFKGKKKNTAKLINAVKSQPKLKQETASNDVFNKPIIDALYLLATPINLKHYAPNMAVIQNVYNFYSRGDSIQQVLGLYNRLIANIPRALNFRVTIEESGIFDDDPSHGEMHDPLLASWLLKIPTELYINELYGFAYFDPYKNGKVHFYKDGTPSFIVDWRTSEERERREYERLIDKALLKDYGPISIFNKSV